VVPVTGKRIGSGVEEIRVADCCYSCVYARDAYIKEEPLLIRCTEAEDDDDIISCYKICEMFKRNPRLK